MHAQDLWFVFLVFTVSYVFGVFAKTYLGQTMMAGRMLAGLSLVLLRDFWLTPEQAEILFPKHMLAFFALLSPFGLMFYQANCSLHVESGHIMKDRKSLPILGLIALLCILASVGPGFLYAYFRLDSYLLPNASRLVFAGIVALSLSLTSIVAMTLSAKEFSLIGGSLSTFMLLIATGDDLAAWGLLPAALGLESGDMREFGKTVLAMAVFIGTLMAAAPILRHVMPRKGLRSVAWYVMLVLLAAAFAESLHLHYLFGSMILGLIIPRATGGPGKEVHVAHGLEVKTKAVFEELFIVVFLFYSTFQCRFVGFNASSLLLCAELILVASAIKMIPTMLSARFIAKRTWLESSIFGACMNLRGLMTLMILSVAREFNLFSTELYTALIIMALVTTMMTAPILNFLKWAFPEEFKSLMVKPEGDDHDDDEHRPSVPLRARARRVATAALGIGSFFGGVLPQGGAPSASVPSPVELTEEDRERRV